MRKNFFARFLRRILTLKHINLSGVGPKKFTCLTLLCVGFGLPKFANADTEMPVFPKQVQPDCAIVWAGTQPNSEYVQCLDFEGIITESTGEKVLVDLVSNNRLRNDANQLLVPLFKSPPEELLFQKIVPSELASLISRLKDCEITGGCGTVFEDKRVFSIAQIETSKGAWKWTKAGPISELASVTAYFFDLGGQIVVFHGIGETPWKAGKFNVFRFFVIDNRLG